MVNTLPRPRLRFSTLVLLAVYLLAIPIPLMAQTDSAASQADAEVAVNDSDANDALIGQPTASETYAEGIRAFAEGDYKRAATLWLQEAYLGSADAQFNVGVLYVEGKGLGENRGEAVFWFTRAARQNHREAQYNLGHLLLEEKEDLGKIKEGVGWWYKSADNGFPIAQFNYGRALFYGVGIEENRPAARQWFERAASGGNERAATFIEQHQGEFIEATPRAKIIESVAVSGADASAAQQSGLSPEQAATSEFVLVKDTPILMYSRFNTLSPVVTRLGAKILLKVVRRNRDWILVEVPGGVPGWLRADSSKINKGQVEVTATMANVYADPTENSEFNDIGKLQRGAKVLLLEQEQKWVRVLLPEKVSGWIEAKTVDNVKATPEEIAKVWQTQSIRRRVATLESRKVKIAANAQPETVTGLISGMQITSQDSSAIAAENLARSQTILVASDEPAGPVGIVIEAIPSVAVSVESEAPLSKVPAAAVSKPIEDQIIVYTEGQEDDVQVLASGTIGSPKVEIASTEAAQQIVANAQQFSAEVEQTDAPESEPQVESARLEAASTVAGDQAGSIDTERPPAESVALVSPVSSTIHQVNQSGVAVLIGPSDSATEVVSLPLNTLVDIVSEVGDFSEVTIPGGLPVWIQQQAGEVRNEKVYIVSSRARAKPLPEDTDDAVLGLLPQGSVMIQIGQQSGWLRVVAPEWITGWVPRASLQRPDSIAGVDQVWRQQARSLLTSYLGEDITELAVVPDLQDTSLLGTDISNDNQWLFEKSSRKYTLQLFSMPNPSSARSLFKSLNGRGQFFSTMVKGQRWYFVMLGKFLTTEAAKAVAAKLPPWANGARVRSLARLQVNRCKKIGEYNEDEAKNLAELCR